MTEALLTPYDLSEPVRAGRRRFWKRILPVKQINYKGRKINFDSKYHTDLADSFKQGAFEQVPLVFAGPQNEHNMDPRNFGGDIIDLQARNDGTWALIEADRDAAKAIRKNPKLGVSARIIEGVAKADGRTFKRAVNHVLLTMNPRVSGLGPWQAVELSDEDAEIEVVDLTAETYQEGNPMARKKANAETGDREIDLSALSDEQFQQLLDLADTMLADPEADEDADEDEQDEQPTSRKIRRKKSKTKITVEKDSEDEGDPDEDDEDEDEDTDLSEVVDSDARDRVRTMEINLAEQRWEAERGDFERAGVPPFLLDLAEPVLSQPEALTIDLSDDESIDATDTIRQMLNGVKGIIDFSDEIGHAIDLSDAIKEGESNADKLLAAWEQGQYS